MPSRQTEKTVCLVVTPYTTYEARQQARVDKAARRWSTVQPHVWKEVLSLAQAKLKKELLADERVKEAIAVQPNAWRAYNVLKEQGLDVTYKLILGIMKERKQ